MKNLQSSTTPNLTLYVIHAHPEFVWLKFMESAAIIFTSTFRIIIFVRSYLVLLEKRNQVKRCIDEVSVGLRLNKLNVLSGCFVVCCLVIGVTSLR